jgi:hypothetical protein
MHYFLCLGGPGAVSVKSTSGHIMPKFGFHIPSDQQVTYWISVRLGCKMSTHYFSCSSGTGTGSTKSLLGHVTPNLCFCIRWDQRVTWCILVRSRRETSTYYFSCSGEPDAVSIKSVPGHGTLNLCFCIRGFYGSHIAFWCVRGVKHRRAIFHARVGSVQFLENCGGKHYAKLVFSIRWDLRVT